jgi:cobyrinic acid a,c-diamide synthase
VVTAIPRIVVAAPASGSGKTTVATGLMAALRSRGLTVSAHKVGPDFIDPTYHSLATGRPGRNLDAFLCAQELIAPLFLHGARGADIAVVEGVMGLYDGVRGTDVASTAHVAKLLDAPVLLVVDARSMSGSVAAMVHGFRDFDRGVRVAGVLLNRVGSPTHESMLRESLAPLGIPVVGALYRNDGLTVPARHLGLVPAVENDSARGQLQRLGLEVGSSCELDAVVEIARTAPALSDVPWDPAAVVREPVTGRPTVAVAMRSGFGFAYAEHLELLTAAGADVEVVDLTEPAALGRHVGALYLPGGFPEVFAAALSETAAARESVAAFAAAGGPVLAECGGMLYLLRQLDGRPMAGAVDAAAEMTTRLAMGYREAEVVTGSLHGPAGTRVRAHEFHYSRTLPSAGAAPAWRIGDRLEGFVQGGVHASYLHTHWAGTPVVARNLAAAAAAHLAAVPA